MYSSRVNVFGKACNAVWPFRDDPSSDVVLLFAGTYLASYLVPAGRNSKLQDAWYLRSARFNTRQYAFTVPSARTPAPHTEVASFTVYTALCRSSCAFERSGKVPMQGKAFRCTWRPQKLTALTLVKVTLVMTELRFTWLRSHQFLDVLKPRHKLLMCRG